MYRFLKRTIDLVSSLSCTLLLLPLLLPLGVILSFSGEGEVFYLQKRMGYKRRTFNIYKFATMLKDSPNMPGGSITVRNDPRLLPLGGFLRKSKINELPQLLNIIRGDMSLVGPRPLMPVSFEMYPADVQRIVYESVPGLTGIGSLVFRDEERLVTETDMEPRQFYREYVYPYKGQLEAWYYRHRSFWVDLKIIFLTAWQVLFSESQLVWRIFPDLPRPPSGLGLS